MHVLLAMPSLLRTYAVPIEYAFAVPIDIAWQGTVKALAEEERITTLDRESGLLVTEYKTINNLVQALVPTPMYGRRYKNGYTVHLDKVSPEQTLIRVRSSLSLEQLGIFHDEIDDAAIKALMRQELFRKICLNLELYAGKCITLFPDLHAVSVSCPAPQSVALQAAPTGQEPVPAQMAAKSIVVPVKKLQQALITAGYDPGPLDGVMGQRTKTAIAHFQSDNGLAGEGDINAATLQGLGF